MKSLLQDQGSLQQLSIQTNDSPASSAIPAISGTSSSPWLTWAEQGCFSLPQRTSPRYQRESGGSRIFTEHKARGYEHTGWRMESPWFSCPQPWSVLPRREKLQESRRASDKQEKGAVHQPHHQHPLVRFLLTRSPLQIPSSLLSDLHSVAATVPFVGLHKSRAIPRAKSRHEA